MMISLFALVFPLSFNPAMARPAIKKETATGVQFLNLKDGATLKSPFKVEMGVQGKTVHVANEQVDDKAAGHHHLLINSDFIPEGQPIPADEKHIHYGKGQTDAEVTLTPGKYKLTLQFADGAHRSYGQAWSKTINVQVR